MTEVNMRKSRAAKKHCKNFKRRLQQRGDVGLMQQSRELKVLNLNVKGLAQESFYDVSKVAIEQQFNVVALTYFPFHSHNSLVLF